MRAGTSLCLLLSLSLVLLTPRLTQAFRKNLTKKTTLDTKALAQLETFASDTTKGLEEISKSVDAMVNDRRASICCYGEPSAGASAAGGHSAELYSVLALDARLG